MDDFVAAPGPDNNNAALAADGIQINARDRLFHAIFIKTATLYVRLVPKWLRTFLEILILAKALVLFTTLSYIHFTFSKTPMDCLEPIKDNWPRDGILQVQIMKNHFNVTMKKLPPYFASEHDYSWVTNITNEGENAQCPVFEEKVLNDSHYTEHKFDSRVKTRIENSYPQNENTNSLNSEGIKTSNIKFHGYSTDFPSMQQLLHFYAQKQVKDHYVMEYALEYGFLRLSQETRQRLKIPVKLVTLDPKKDKCFGDSLSRFILDKFLGYDDILMGSIKRLAERENNQGFMKNVLTGEHYKFVSLWMGRTSYIVSFLLMFVFTVSISTLLRFCHQQIFIFIVHLLHVMDWNVTYAFPIAPLFTVILSLVGMEAIMAEFFNDTTTSFYVILMVWAGDQFDSICCHTKLSQKFWPRFFFLYHFVFYAYHYRFNGQYSTIALASTWFFIQHSMLYFLHNYEIPAIQGEINGEGNFAANYLDDAVDFLVDEVQFPTVDVNGQPNVVINDSTAQEDSVIEDSSAQQNSVVSNSDPVYVLGVSDSGTQQNMIIDSGARKSEVINEFGVEQDQVVDTEHEKPVISDSIVQNLAMIDEHNQGNPLICHQEQQADLDAGEFISTRSSENYNEKRINEFMLEKTCHIHAEKGYYQEDSSVTKIGENATSINNKTTDELLETRANGRSRTNSEHEKSVNNSRDCAVNSSEDTVLS